MTTTQQAFGLAVRRLRREAGYPLSTPLLQGLGAISDSGGKAILLLNRRGYSSFIMCSECAYVVACPNCSITLTYHRTPERLVCHYCQHREEPRASFLLASAFVFGIGLAAAESVEPLEAVWPLLQSPLGRT